MPFHLTIFKKGLILVAVPLLFQLAFLGLVARMQQENADAQEWASHSQDVIRETDVVLAGMVDAETGIRGYALTTDPAFTEPYDRAAREVPEGLHRLRDLVRDNPEQGTRAERVAQKAAAALAWLAETERLVRAGSADRAAAREGTMGGKRRMDAFREAVAAFRSEEERLGAVRTRTLAASQRRLNWLLAAGGLIAFSTAATLALVFSRGVIRRLHTLAENARRLSRGDRLAPPGGGTDEIAALDHAFHDMARELRGSQLRLRDQVQVLESILNNIGDGVTVADEQGAFLVFNPAAERILGRGRTDAGPDGWSEQYGIYLPDGTTPWPPRDLPLARAMRGEAVDAVVMRVRTPRLPDGIWVSATARPLPDQDGHPRGGVVVFRDITADKRVEETIRQLNEELERRVAERTAELTEANRELHQKNQENETFVYSVSHDLRSPLVNLEGFSQELALACQDVRDILADAGLPPAVRERALCLVDGDMGDSIRFIRTAVRRLSNIIDALLRLSRAGRIEYQRQPVDVDATTRRITDSMRATIDQRGAAVTVRALPPAWGDPTALEQVFANLIGNALNYLDPARPGHIEVGSENGRGPGLPGLQTYYVKDNGLGIPEAYQHKVFQAFQRVHPEAAPGEGMGLAIVRRIVERHQGKVWVESRPGEGSTFFVALPTKGSTA